MSRGGREGSGAEEFHIVANCEVGHFGRFCRHDDDVRVSQVSKVLISMMFAILVHGYQLSRENGPNLEVRERNCELKSFHHLECLRDVGSRETI